MLKICDHSYVFESLFYQAKEGSHEHGDEQQSSKEVTPEKDEVSWFSLKTRIISTRIEIFFIEVNVTFTATRRR